MTSSSSLSLYLLPGNTFNRGDRANLLCQIQLLRQQWPDCEIILPSFNAKQEAAYYDATVIQRRIIPTWNELRHMRRADCIVWGGGALLVDKSGVLSVPYWLGMVVLARLLGTPVFCWAQGLVLQTQWGKFCAKQALRLCAGITLRDAHSMQQARELGVHAIQTADPALCMHKDWLMTSPDTNRSSKRLHIAISANFWEFYHKPHHIWYRFAGPSSKKAYSAEAVEPFLRELAALIDQLVVDLDADIILPAHYVNNHWPDAQLLQQVATYSAYPQRISIRSADIPPRVDWGIWPQLDLCIAHTMHNAIVSEALGVPCVHLPYEPKGIELAERVEATQWTTHWSHILQDGGPQYIARLAQERLRHTHHHPSAALQALQAKAANNVMHLHACLYDER